ncbi:hypothetical protein APY04_0339 [Hyphomicrobium sulfonivorans]|uniref:Uncharacterized protein n=1 Tax=Hyphomicrobium sulfonivorans TaxID=121290 RepID=A0A109BNH3_HYPSL|nr:hypothetical protein APY04_0339 [Hyphomicrobium sulfonivorans]
MFSTQHGTPAEAVPTSRQRKRESVMSAVEIALEVVIGAATTAAAFALPRIGCRVHAGTRSAHAVQIVGRPLRGGGRRKTLAVKRLEGADCGVEAERGLAFFTHDDPDGVASDLDDIGL